VKDPPLKSEKDLYHTFALPLPARIMKKWLNDDHHQN
jgi:hypothetical protein